MEGCVVRYAATLRKEAFSSPLMYDQREYLVTSTEGIR